MELIELEIKADEILKEIEKHMQDIEVSQTLVHRKDAAIRTVAELNETLKKTIVEMKLLINETERHKIMRGQI
jgi:hypothetical protein